MLDIVLISYYNGIKGGADMPMSESKKRANAKYNAKAYEQLMIRLKKGERAKLKSYTDSHNISVNSFAAACMSHCIENGIDVSNAKPLGEVLSDTEGDER